MSISVLHTDDARQRRVGADPTPVAVIENLKDRLGRL